ncbi:hypothetical protein M0R45_012489 [Rubus argutus]|uniref:J domain-containing protein n=1 Tax=Rubus argutus TaxID=59490 RepID=A0AAW1YE49_RUBAR
MEYQTSSVSVSQKLSTGHSIYDGVFSSAPSNFMVSAFSSRLEDYDEIFGGSSSIPVLEVPELSERKASVDVRSSKLDYSNVFGGFGDSDFAVPYEELFAEPKKKNKLHKESRTQTPKEANPSCPEENVDLSHEAGYESFDGVNKFRMSYNKSNHRSKSFGRGTTGIAELHAVPAYTCLIDEETTPVSTTQGDKPLPSEANNASTVNGVERIMEGSHHMKATKDHQSTDANKQTSGGVAKAQNASNWKRSGSIDSLFSSGEIGQGTSHSNMPPFPRMLSQGKGKFEKPMASLFGVSNSDIFEGADSVSSPPYFDEEVDTNSVAAASVAALTKAIEEAQASIQMAKELMDRKKVGLQSRVKLSFDNSTKLESRKGDNFADKASVSKKKTTKEVYDKVDVPVHVSAGPEQVTPAFEDASIISGVKVTGREMHGKEFAGDASIFKEKKSQELHEEVDVTVHVSARPEQVTATVEDADKLGDWKEIQGKGHGKDCEPTPTDHRHQEADSEAAEQFYEFADTGEHDVLEAAERFYEFADSSEPDVSEAAEEFYEFADSNEDSDTTLENEAFETPEQGSKSIKVVTEEENREVEKIVNVVGGISEFEDHANELASAQEVYHQEDIDKSQDAPREHGETWKLKATHVKETFEEKQNGDDKMFENQELQETEHVKIKLVAQERVENEKIDREACMQEENEREQKDGHMAEDTERSLNKDSRQEIIETVNDFNDEDDFAKRLKDDSESEGNEKVQDTRANEKLQKDGHMAEDTERSLNKDSRQEIIETVNDFYDEDDFAKRLKDDSESEGNEKLQDTRSNEKLQKDAHMAEDTERSLNKDSRQEIIETVNDLNDEVDFEKRRKDDGKSEGNEKLQSTRGNEKLQKDAHMAEVTEGSLNKDSRQEIIETVNDFNDKDDFEKTLKDDGESEGNEKLQDTRANEKILEGYNCQKKECENREGESFKSVEAGRMQILIDESTEDEKVKATQEDQLNPECNFEAADNQYEHEEASTRHVEYDNDVEETLKVPTHEEDGGMIEVAETLIELKENEHRSELPEEKNGMEEKEMCETDGSAPGVKLPEMLKQMEDATEIHSFDKNGINASRNDMSIGQKQDDHLAEEPNVDCSLGRQVEEFEESGDINKDMMAAEVAVNQERNNNSSKPRKRWFGTNEVSETLIKLEEDGSQSESVEEEDVMEEKVICEIEGLAPGVKLADILVQMEDVIETHPSDTNGTSVYRNAMNCGKKRDAQLAREPEVSCNLGKHVEEHGEINDMMEAEVAAVSHEENMHNTKSSHRKRWFDDGNDTKVAQAPLIFGRKGGSVLLDHEMETSLRTKRNKENRHKVMASQSTEGNEENQQSTLRPKESETIYRSPKELEQENNENPQATLSSEESETDHSSQEDGKEGIKVSQAPLKTEESETNYTSQKEVEREKKENQQETPTAKEFEISDSSQKEVELQKEHMIQKAAKRLERERLKDKKAAERAMREARERSFAEARERAAESRQKVMAEAQGRLGKTSVQANDTSLAEKASKEAKLKLERAAVERATVEARERALEKALSEKAAYEAGKQAKRSVSEKYSGASTDGKAKRSVSEKVPGSSRDNGMKLSFDPESKSSFPSSSSRSPNSLNQCDPSSAESTGGTNGESAQRNKARLERNQRTAERAAKALAEKNNRDLLVQQEQAERNRLAEVLDAEVKRWSSGKERNLRALLSTLQYILGPDSGWQPIPLTDIVTAVAVKKAYRKAALFVHPDKLQQRGASIQQKYTCEKVFDLLKEAWNRFSVEER